MRPPEPAELVSSATISLPASLDLTEAEPLRQLLCSRLQESAMVIDAGAVERISTPCLQILVAAAASAAHRDIPFRLLNGTEVLSSAIDDLGLAAAISVEN